MTDLKVKIIPVAGCSHIKIEIYTANDMILRRTLTATRSELLTRLGLDHVNAEERLISQIKSTVLANETNSWVVIKNAIEGETYLV